MNAEEEASAADEKMVCCASCGQAEIDDVKLKNCACNLVKYCSVACQKNHRSQHKNICKKRLAELRDNYLFEQPEDSCFGECPICCLPLSLDKSKSTMMACCSKLICIGCLYANQKREIELGLEMRCPFCRGPMPKSQEEARKKIMKRIKENNDPAAMCQMGKGHWYEGDDYETAFKYLAKAAELGDIDAHYVLSIMYDLGQGAEKDTKMEIHHLEEAAIGGHPDARHNLGVEEWNNCRFERARKHFTIAANLGNEDSLNCLKQLYADGHASEEDYANALRAYETAVEATKSSDREKAEETLKNGEARAFTA